MFNIFLKYNLNFLYLEYCYTYKVKELYPPDTYTFIKNKTTRKALAFIQDSNKR